eukprot:14224003-Ditylum_brightwellii.AAC.1
MASLRLHRILFLVRLCKKGCDGDDDNNDELSSLGRQSTMEVFDMPDDVHAAHNNQNRYFRLHIYAVINAYYAVEIISHQAGATRSHK